MSRLPRNDTPGSLHHVMARGIEKGLIMHDDYDRARLLEMIGQVAENTKTAVYAFAFMPNHLHLLVRSGESGLAHFMRRLLTGYALYFNRRHKRVGYLFQNRYKSKLCQEEVYFAQLVAYIHLNPYKAGMVSSLHVLNRYRWTSHPFLLGLADFKWMDREYVLSFFGNDIESARANYLKVLTSENDIDHYEAFEGSGKERACDADKKQMKTGAEGGKQECNSGILGTSDFVDKVMSGKPEKPPGTAPRFDLVQDEIHRQCLKHDCCPGQLLSGGKARPLPQIRKALAKTFTGEFGLSISAAAKVLGVTIQGVMRMLRE